MPFVQRLRNITLVIAAVSIGFTSSPTAAHADTTLANWGQQSPAQAPAGRAYAAMAYDSLRGRTVFFGGDTWEWDGSHWSTFLTTVSPPSSIGPGMVYDSDRHVIVLLDNGGNTWEWNGSNWIQRATAASPPARLWTSMVYDSFRQRTVLFGGSASGGVDLGDTWTYDGTNWTKMAPTSAPSARFGMAISFDSARDVVVLFGGRAAGQRMNDTWEWDGANWTQRTPTALPFARFWHSMVYDTQLGMSVMWGGDHIEPFALGPINDTWLWDGTKFGSGIVTPAGNPSLSFQVNMMYFRSSGIGTTTSPARLRIFGAGTGPPLISSITTTGDFAVAATDCPIAPNPLAVGAFCNVQFTFTPTVCGTVTGSLVFADSAAGGSESVALEGGVLSAGCDGDLGLIASKDVTVNATSPAGATISYNGLTNFDEDSTPGPITCSPALNSTFPIGTTTVTCQITDSDDVTSTVSATFRVTVNDTDLALTGAPSDITVGAAGPSGTAVTYTAPSAVDEDAGTPAVSCTPASGSIFPIGTTTVTCGASDGDDTPSTVTATFRVIVGDSDLALSSIPANVTVQATTAGGAAVGFFPPTAVDEDATAPSVTCDHGSGSLFPVGTTTVTCQTTDGDDTPSTVTATFQVTVIDTDLGLSGVPADITVDAAGPSGAAVTFVAPTGVDEDGSAVAVSCDHASGA
ncbi:MAG: HYR domain-containing protein, partial [Chloroflexi bacterium]